MIVLAALIDKKRRVLVTSRPQGKMMAGWWEFPGGKVEKGEAPAAALCRELGEELAITVNPGDLVPMTFAEEHPKQGALLLLLYLCRVWQGTPQGCEGQRMVWRPISALDAPFADGGKMLATNTRLISVLRDGRIPSL